MLCGSFRRVVLSKLLCERSRTRTKDLYFMPFYSKEWMRKIFSVSFIQIQLLKNHENLVHCLTLFANFQYFDKKTCILIVFCNLPIEQLRPEVNNRVNYPSKRLLNEMENSQIIDMKDDVVKYCISPVSCMVSSYGLLN